MRVQAQLRAQLVLQWDGHPVRTIGGVDVSLTDMRAHAAIVVLRYPDLTPIEGVTADAPLVFPYIPGLLAFREGPAILAAWERLQHRPDLIMFDGQGIAHPRGVGIASQMGLWLERPTIGVAKSRLYGDFKEPEPHAGAMSDLVDPQTKQVIGVVLRTRERAKPLFVSPGHLIDVAHAADWVMRCVRGYRLPEPTRWAHKFASGEALPGTGDGHGGDQLTLF
ncbi:MAG: deoxyribonuclease V [Anaerolineae bacterium]|nr:deoxyribonuclease V [Anaerolineae bacterium]